MNVRGLLLGLTGAVMGWLEPSTDDAADFVTRAGRVSARDEEVVVVGSPIVGYYSEGGRFYTWQPERSEVVSWVAELGPFDRGGSRGA
jgi:hypothetical protein